MSTCIQSDLETLEFHQLSPNLSTDIGKLKLTNITKAKPKNVTSWLHTINGLQP